MDKKDLLKLLSDIMFSSKSVTWSNVAPKVNSPPIAVSQYQQSSSQPAPIYHNYGPGTIMGIGGSSRIVPFSSSMLFDYNDKLEFMEITADATAAQKELDNLDIKIEERMEILDASERITEDDIILAREIKKQGLTLEDVKILGALKEQKKG